MVLDPAAYTPHTTTPSLYYYPPYCPYCPYCRYCHYCHP
jgi:hypothetical protein